MNRSCSFFGHKDCPHSVKNRLYNTVKQLIVEKNVTTFYVGNQGQFDDIARTVLKQLKTEYPRIEYFVVLAYLPVQAHDHEEYADTVLPEGIERVPPRYAIAWRNNWMLANSSFVVAYITHTWGGAYTVVSKAIKKNKHVINLG